MFLNVSSPDFTACFHLTVLTWLPGLYLACFAPLAVWRALGSPTRSLPLSLPSLVRTLLNLVGLGAAVLEAAMQATAPAPLSTAELLAPLTRAAALGLALGLVQYDARQGVRGSGIIFGFWLLATLCSAVTFASVIRFGSKPGQTSDSSLTIIYFAINLTVLFLLFFSEPEPSAKSLELATERPSPELAASYPSFLTFSWFDPMIRLGWSRPLTRQDLYDIKPSERTSVVFPKWFRNWSARLERDRTEGRAGQTSVLAPIFQTFGREFLLSSLVQLVTVLLQQLSPQTLNLLIGFTSSQQEQWKGFLYMGLLVTINLTNTLLNSQYFKEQTLIGLRMRSALTSTLYRKSLRLSSRARKERSVGETVNLMQLDTQRIMDVILQLNLVWSSPTTIALSLYSLWGLLGPSCLAGLAVMLVMIPVNAVISARMKKFQRANMRTKDSRMKLMNEILDGMKVLKLYAWEPSFQQQVSRTRSGLLNIFC